MAEPQPDGLSILRDEWEEGEIMLRVDNIHYATQTQEGWQGQPI